MSDSANMSKEELIRSAWERWREVDYSWEGLLNPRKKTEGYSSRQEYWRIDPLDVTRTPRDDAALRLCGELVEENGYAHHIAHLPLHYPDGNPTKKIREFAAVQKQLETLIHARLNAATAPINDEDAVKAKKAHLQGVVFLPLNLSKAVFPHPINAKFNRCFFAGNESEKGTAPSERNRLCVKIL